MFPQLLGSQKRMVPKTSSGRPSRGPAAVHGAGGETGDQLPGENLGWCGRSAGGYRPHRSRRGGMLGLLKGR